MEDRRGDEEVSVEDRRLLLDAMDSLRHDAGCGCAG